jgi:hypothetical protein
MKAKYLIGIVSAFLLVTPTLKAQTADINDLRNNDAGIVINNYYNDYDYYYSSRINRFHRSYTAFDYYAPVFTDPYFYDYQPFSWGLSIYGGNGFGLGFSLNYPVYNFGYSYYNGYNPYFGSSYYWGYDPFWYDSWYFPIVINFNFMNRWHNDYYGWKNHQNRYNDLRPGHHRYNNKSSYTSQRYSSHVYTPGRSSSANRESPIRNIQRRAGSSNTYSRSGVERSGRIAEQASANRSASSRSVSTYARSSSSSRTVSSPAGTSSSSGRISVSSSSGQNSARRR